MALAYCRLRKQSPMVEEQEDYLTKADDPENDHYVMESYSGHAMQFGTIALYISEKG